MTDKPYGMECVVDVHGCTHRFTRSSIEKFFVELCGLLEMKRANLVFWDYEGQEEEYEAAPPHLKGTSAVQFIRTSNITLHSLDDLKRLYLNVFSCQAYDPKVIRSCVERWTGGSIVNFKTLTRI